jgi:hypothetical protein
MTRYSLLDCIQTALTLSMRAIEEVRALARMPGPRGERGEPGKDGLGFGDLRLRQVDDRTYIVEASRDGEVKEVGTITNPCMLYKGVYKDGSVHQRGDVITWAGCLWHANDATMDKPGDGSKNWTLAVKCGRDGRNGKDGDRGDRGPEGKPGRDATALSFDGKKY